MKLIDIKAVPRERSIFIKLLLEFVNVEDDVEGQLVFEFYELWRNWLFLQENFCSIYVPSYSYLSVQAFYMEL